MTAASQNGKGEKRHPAILRYSCTTTVMYCTLITVPPCAIPFFRTIKNLQIQGRRSSQLSFGENNRQYQVKCDFIWWYNTSIMASQLLFKLRHECYHYRTVQYFFFEVTTRSSIVDFLLILYFKPATIRRTGQKVIWANESNQRTEVSIGGNNIIQY